MNGGRRLLRSYSQPARQETWSDELEAALFPFENVYHVNIDFCFNIVANDDLNDFVKFGYTFDDARNIGVTLDWAVKYLVGLSKYSIFNVQDATLSVTPYINSHGGIDSCNLGCGNGLEFAIYAPSTMCLKLVLITRIGDDIKLLIIY